MAKVFVDLFIYINKIEKEYVEKFGENMRSIFEGFRNDIKNTEKKKK